MCVHRRTTVQGCIALVAALACSEVAGPIAVASIALDAATVTLLVGPGGGETRQFEVDARDAKGRVVRGRTAAWSSDDAQVATVSIDGLVAATGIGSTTVRATVEGRNASATINVVRVPVRTVIVEPGAISLIRGPSVQGTLAVAVTARDSAGNLLDGLVVHFNVANPEIASVSAQGMLTAADLGDTELIVDIEGAQDTVPVTVVEQADSWLQLSIGSAHTCGIASDNVLYCWGFSTHGQLGLGPIPMAPVTRPEQVGGPLRFQTVQSTFRHTCALTLAGAAYCWGENSEGKLGDGTTETRSVPTPVSGGLTFASLAVSASRSCGISVGGMAYCWGSGGGGTADSTLIRDRWTPTLVAYGRPFVQLALGLAHTCALDVAGEAWCWGSDDFGQLGNGADPWSQYPVAVSGGHLFTRLIGGGSYTSCGHKADASLWCWGWDPRDEYGVESVDALQEPTLFAAAGVFADVAVGGGHPTLCGVLAAAVDAGSVACFGDNDWGQVGDGTTAFRSAATVVGGTTGARATAVGQYLSCVVGPRALCWGRNAEGALGDGTVNASLTPVIVRARWQ